MVQQNREKWKAQATKGNSQTSQWKNKNYFDLFFFKLFFNQIILQVSTVSLKESAFQGQQPTVNSER